MKGTEQFTHLGDTDPLTSVAVASEGPDADTPQHPSVKIAQHITSVQDGSGMRTQGPNASSSYHAQAEQGQTSYEQDPHAASAFEAVLADQVVVPFAAVKRLVVRVGSPIVEFFECIAYFIGEWLVVARRFVHDHSGAVYAMTIGSTFFLTLLILETKEK